MNLDIGISGSSSAQSGASNASPFNVTGGGGNQSLATAANAVATAASSPKLWLLIAIPAGLAVIGLGLWLISRKGK